jgi:hypothetical protein
MDRAEDAKLATAFFRRFCEGLTGGVLDTGTRWLVFGGTWNYDLNEVRTRVKEDFLIEWEAVSDDGVQWAMSVSPLLDDDFSNDMQGYADWVRASEYHEDLLWGIVRRYKGRHGWGENAAGGRSGPADAEVARGA